MKDLPIGLKKVLKKGTISSELDFQRATQMDRRLRLMIREFPELEVDRQQLRTLLKAYEDRHWSGSEVTDQQVAESDLSEKISELEFEFTQLRKQAIKDRLKEMELSQKELGELIGHPSASYMSELMNGVSPFTLNDLVLIHKLLHIELRLLIPTILPHPLHGRLRARISKLNNPHVQLADEVELLQE